MINPEILIGNSNRQNSSNKLWADLTYIMKDGGANAKRGVFRGFFPYCVAMLYNNLNWYRVVGELKGDPTEDYTSKGKQIPREFFKEFNFSENYNVREMFSRIYILNLALNSFRMRQGLSIHQSKYKKVT